MNRKIADGSDGQIELQGLPVVAVIERYVNSEFGSGEEQGLILSIFSDDSRAKAIGEMPSVIGCQVAP